MHPPALLSVFVGFRVGLALSFILEMNVGVWRECWLGSGSYEMLMCLCGCGGFWCCVRVVYSQDNALVRRGGHPFTYSSP